MIPWKRMRTMQKRRYPDELKQRAVRLVIEARQDSQSGRGAAGRIGAQLGIPTDTLRGWVERAEIDTGIRPGTTTDEHQRLVELEKENRELRRANAILKSASAFFAAELDRPSSR